VSTSHAPAAAGHHHPEPPEARRPWTVLGLMLAAQFMVVLDVSVVNVALPSIGADLHLSSSSYQWTVSAYVLLSGGLLLLGGRLADLVDRRTVFLTGLTLFTGASLASGFAGDATALVLSRSAQGAGAALLTPAALSVVMTTYAGRQRATALAVWGTVGSMGIAAGVLFGGILTSAFDWRAVFFVNVPIGLAVLVGTVRSVPRGRSQGLRGLDLPGALMLVGGLLALVRTIEEAGREGWTTTSVVTGTLAATLLTAFALLERRVASPLVPPRVWRVRSLVSASTVMAGVTGAVVGAIFLSSLFLQQVLGSSPVVAGLQFLLIAIGLVVSAGAALLLSTAGSDATYAADVLPGFLLLGAGVGPMFVAISVGAMSDVPDHASGLASGLMMTGHEVGAALGVAVLTTVAGDITTRAGLVAGYGDAFVAVAVLLLVLLVPTTLVPRTARAGAAGHHGH